MPTIVTRILNALTLALREALRSSPLRWATAGVVVLQCAGLMLPDRFGSWAFVQASAADRGFGAAVILLTTLLSIPAIAPISDRSSRRSLCGVRPSPLIFAGLCLGRVAGVLAMLCAVGLSIVVAFAMRSLFGEVSAPSQTSVTDAWILLGHAGAHATRNIFVLAPLSLIAAPTFGRFVGPALLGFTAIMLFRADISSAECALVIASSWMISAGLWFAVPTRA